MLLLPLLLACSTEPSVPPPPPVTEAELAEAVAAAICKAATQAEKACSVEGARADFGWKALDIEVTGLSWLTLDPTTLGHGDQAERFPGEAQLSATIGLGVDGKPLLATPQAHTAADLDLGVARNKVLDELSQRWVVTHASAVMDALLGDTSAPVISSLGMNVPAQPQGALHAWAGYPVLRGKGFDPGIANKLGPSLQTMLANLDAFTEGLSEGLHTVVVEARLGGAGAPGPCGIIPPVAMSPGATTSIVPFSGRVLVDGEPVGDICALSEPVAWPLPPKGAVLEWDQLAVLAPAQAAAGGGEGSGEADPG